MKVRLAGPPSAARPEPIAARTSIRGTPPTSVAATPAIAALTSSCPHEQCRASRRRSTWSAKALPARASTISGTAVTSPTSPTMAALWVCSQM
jgi:hypothetical protein